MKKLMIACAALAAGCHTAHVEVSGDGRWSADIYDNGVTRNLDGFEAEVAEGGKFKVKLNGMRSDVSEQVPVITKETLYGIAVLGRLFGTMANPAVAGVPLTSEPASAETVAASSELAELRGKCSALEAENASLKKQAASPASCEGGACGDKTDCPGGVCEDPAGS